RSPPPSAPRTAIATRGAWPPPVPPPTRIAGTWSPGGSSRSTIGSAPASAIARIGPRALASRWRREQRRQPFVLVGGDEVDAGLDAGLPPLARRARRAEVVALGPAVAAARLVAVQRVEADPQPLIVRAGHQRREPGRVCRRPLAGTRLAAALHYRPREI